MTPLRLAVFLVLVLPHLLLAVPSCPAIFGDHMVLQRDRPVRIWGKGAAGEQITVQFGDLEQKTTTRADGAWAVELPSMKANTTPRSLCIMGETTLQFNDVLVGEVWLCSGQSNMEKNIGPRAKQKPTDNWEEDLAKAENPILRLYQVPRRGILKAPEVGLCWVPSNAENLKATGFSAAAWHFGRELTKVLGVPVGLIHASYGGTRIEPWTPHEAFARVPSLAEFAAAPAGTKVDGIETCKLYDSMIAPLVPYTLKGFLWYQGESNCMNADTVIYADKMRALVEGWRAAWSSPKAPFYYVMLAPWTYSKRETKQHPLSTYALPMLWEAQIKALSIPNTGIVPSSDITSDLTDIHPTNKRDIGLRLARLALSRDYHQDIGLVEAPRFDKIRIKQDLVRVDFLHAEGGLSTRDGKEPNEFLLAGADRVFHPAKAKITGKTVELVSTEVKRPVAVRYAFHEEAVPNLMNRAGLPALSFRSDSWSVLVEKAMETPEPAPTAPSPSNQANK